MRNRRLVLLIGAICLASSFTLVKLLSDHPVAYAQQPAASDNLAVFRSETRLVLVDTVVTDKKGNYIRDLEQKDFRVWEDGKEQALTSFSYEENTGSPANVKPRYLVLFFDNSTMDMGDQIKARDAAAKFIDANAGPDRLIAIADFGGTVHISQNFTADASRLKQVVAGLKGSTVSPNADPVRVASLAPPTIGPSLGNAEADFGVHNVLLALRSIAKGMSGVPGRKTLVMLTSGFPMNPEYQSELTAVIDTCNKSNVAIYPIDVRGLTVPGISAAQQSPHSRLVLPSAPFTAGSLIPATLHYSGKPSQYPVLRLAAFAEPAAFPPQHTGGGGGGTAGGGTGGGIHAGTGATGGSGGTGGGGKGGTGGTGTGGTGGGGKGGTGAGGTGTTGGKGGTGTGGTGSTGGKGGTGYNSNVYNPYSQPRTIVPQFPQSASDNQQVLYQLADGTGGFVIINTNDLLGGLGRIAKDQNQYYLLGYKPAVSEEGTCHTLKIKVDRGGMLLRARTGYCNARPTNLLAGNPIEKDLETRGAGEIKGNVAALMQAPYFYTSPNTAQVHLAVDIPSLALKFEKVKGKQHATINILGIAYKRDDSIAARFSDTANIDLDGKKEVEEFQKEPFHYENQFEIASGEYKLRVVFSSGNVSFGKLEIPLWIDAYGVKEFNISGVALSNSIHKASDIATDLDNQLLEDRTPLMVDGMQISPSASNHFKKTDFACIYAEIYEPLLKDPNPPKIAIALRIVERKSGQEKFKVSDRIPDSKGGNPVIPLGLQLPVSKLDPGSYRMELQAADSAGNNSKIRTADFEVE